MKNHLNILPKLASFDLKCSKMRWRLGLRPRPRWGSLRRSPRPPNRKRQRAFGARHSLFRVHFYISIPLSGPPLTEFLDPPLAVCDKYDAAQVWTTVVSQAMYLPADQGMSVALSGRLPSIRRRPDGSFMLGASALCSKCQMISFMA